MLSAVSAPEAGILHHERNCGLNVNRQNIGNGSLYVSEEKVIWENEGHRGLELLYKEIAIHAISTDLQAFPEECLYIMYNGKLQNCNGHAIEHNDSEEDESAGNDFGPQYSSDVTEIRFIPQCKDNLTPMFNAVADGQCLHPDSEDSDDYYDAGDDHQGNPVEYNPTFEDGAGEGFYTTEEGFQNLTPQGALTLQRLENMLAQSGISSQDETEQMTGVIVSDDDDTRGQYDTEPLPVGRPVDESDDISDPPAEGQFDDAD